MRRVVKIADLEAILDQDVVLPAGGSGLGVVFKQDKELLGQLIDILRHGRQRELQHPREGHQSLRDHLIRGRKKKKKKEFGKLFDS